MFTTGGDVQKMPDGKTWMKSTSYNIHVYMDSFLHSTLFVRPIQLDVQIYISSHTPQCTSSKPTFIIQIVFDFFKILVLFLFGTK